MASLAMMRLSVRSATSSFTRPCTRRAPIVAQTMAAKSPFSSSVARKSAGHEEETFEEFSARYDKPRASHCSPPAGFRTHIRDRAKGTKRAVTDPRRLDMKRNLILFRMFSNCRYSLPSLLPLSLLITLQRNLNNAFAYDLVPSPGVVTAALKAARRVNDYPTAVRIFEGPS